MSARLRLRDALKLYVSRPFQSIHNTIANIHVNILLRPGAQLYFVCPLSTSPTTCLDFSKFPGLQETAHVRLQRPKRHVHVRV